MRRLPHPKGRTAEHAGTRSQPFMPHAAQSAPAGSAAWAASTPAAPRCPGPAESTLHLVLRLRGGKGGFGSLLRGAGKQKLTDNFDACRDLQGGWVRRVYLVLRLAPRGTEPPAAGFAAPPLCATLARIVCLAACRCPADAVQRAARRRRPTGSRPAPDPPLWPRPCPVPRPYPCRPPCAPQDCRPEAGGVAGGGQGA